MNLPLSGTITHIIILSEHHVFQVRVNILKTVDGVHKSTDAKEIAKSDAASRWEVVNKLSC